MSRKGLIDLDGNFVGATSGAVLDTTLTVVDMPAEAGDPTEWHWTGSTFVEKHDNLTPLPSGPGTVGTPIEFTGLHPGTRAMVVENGSPVLDQEASGTFSYTPTVAGEHRFVLEGGCCRTRKVIIDVEAV